MNTVKEIQNLNKRELENVVPPSGSWHTDYRDTAYIFIGGLSFDLTEGDIVTIFSQYGEPVWVKLSRDKETGKSKGFAFLKYEDQRSTDLAVDNLGGATVLGRIVRVDHTRYKKKEGEEEDDEAGVLRYNGDDGGNGESSKRGKASGDEDEDRPMIKEEKELAALIRDHDDDDPMKEYLIQEKREEVAIAKAAIPKKRVRSSKESRDKHRHHHHSRRDRDRDRERERERDRDRSRDRDSHHRRRER